jgi:hypothetical protein
MSYRESVKSVTFLAGTGVGVYTGVPGQPGSASPNAGPLHKFVKFSANAGEVIPATGAANEIVVGVLSNKPQAVGAPATVDIQGVAEIVLGGTVAANTPVKVNGSGQAVAATLPGDAALVVAITVQGGVSGDHVPALLRLGN